LKHFGKLLNFAVFQFDFFQAPHTAPKISVPETLDRIKEEFNFIQAQYQK
jgi:hypothetical protein